jgi:hypothetical protein
VTYSFAGSRAVYCATRIWCPHKESNLGLCGKSALLNHSATEAWAGREGVEPPKHRATSLQLANLANDCAARYARIASTLAGGDFHSTLSRRLPFLGAAATEESRYPR